LTDLGDNVWDQTSWAEPVSLNNLFLEEITMLKADFCSKGLGGAEKLAKFE
jgi:hypothetical protein